jgi:hypothetical protein
LQSNALFSSKKFAYNTYQVSYLTAAHGQAVAHDMVLTGAASPAETISVKVSLAFLQHFLMTSASENITGSSV